MGGLLPFALASGSFEGSAGLKGMITASTAAGDMFAVRRREKGVVCCEVGEIRENASVFGKRDDAKGCNGPPQLPTTLNCFASLTAKHQHHNTGLGIMEEQAAHHLLNVLEERGLDSGLDLDSVLAAFEDDDTKRDAAAWVNEYLNEDTLLTKEEFEL